MTTPRALLPASGGNRVAIAAVCGFSGFGGSESWVTTHGYYSAALSGLSACSEADVGNML